MKKQESKWAMILDLSNTPGIEIVDKELYWKDTAVKMFQFSMALMFIILLIAIFNL